MFVPSHKFLSSQDRSISAVPGPLMVCSVYAMVCTGVQCWQATAEVTAALILNVLIPNVLIFEK